MALRPYQLGERLDSNADLAEGLANLQPNRGVWAG